MSVYNRRKSMTGESKAMSPVSDSKYLDSDYIKFTKKLAMYNLPAIHFRQTIRYFKDQVNEVRLKVHIEPNKRRILEPNTDPYYHREMLDHALKTPFRVIEPEFIEEMFVRLGSTRNRFRYPDTVTIVLDEINELYGLVLHYVAVNNRVQPTEGVYIRVYLEGYKRKGKTKNYKKFLQTRAYLTERLFITNSMIRRIYAHAITGLPELALHFDGFRHTSGHELIDVQNAIRKRVIHANVYIEIEWFSTIARIIEEEAIAQSKDTIKKEYFYNFLEAATNVISLHVSLLMRRTMEEYVRCMCDENRTPYIKLQLYWDGRQLQLVPQLDYIESAYLCMFGDLSNIGIFMHCVEFMYTQNFDLVNKYINLDIPDDFKQDLYDQVQTSVKVNFQPVLDHIESIKKSFAQLYDIESKGHKYNIIEMSFEHGCELIEFFLNYIKKIRNMLPNAYFKVAKLDQSPALEHLNKICEKMINLITIKISKLHRIENEDIIEMYEFLKMKCEIVPQCTEELMELMAYMIWASSVHVPMLNERVEMSLQKILHFIDLTNVPYKNIELMSRTVLWALEIKLILEENALMLERVKFQFEDNLQKKVEELHEKISKEVPRTIIFNDMDDSNRAGEYLVILRAMIRRIRKMEEIRTWINKEETLMKFPLTLYPELDELKKDVFPFFRLVSLCHKWSRYYGVWMYGPFENLVYDDIDRIAEEYYKELQKIFKVYRSQIKQQIAENNPKRFQGLIDDPDPLNLPAPLKLCNKTMQSIKEFRPFMVYIFTFCNTAMLQRHWDEMSEIAGFDMTPDAGTTLKKLLEKGLENDIEKYEIISIGATKELQLQTALKKMVNEWEDIHFKTSVYKDTNIVILTQLDDIQAILDDHIIKTLTMRGSVFVKHFEAAVKQWYDKVTRMNATIDVWGKVQSQWLYLLPIFSSKDIVAQMPEEGVLFKEVNNVYTRYMTSVKRDSRVKETAAAKGVLEAMQNCLKLLDKINEGVTNYLEKKRLYFSRFFFLSNDEMLEILSETKDPLRVQPHLRKCFEGINKLEFNSKLEILAMFSQEGERIKFVQSIDTEAARGSVEKWLLQVENQMLVSVRNEIKESFEDYAATPKRVQWILRWPGQVVLAISQSYWTARVHNSLQDKTGKRILKFFSQEISELEDIVDLIRSKDLSNLSKITIRALIVIDVHAKDVVNELILHKVKHENEFKWLAQLRYYWEEENELVRMINATVPYAYEYLGNSDRLVITPLTDRCYRTLIGAYHLHLNGAPEGPAGTGKTETTKDLAKALAVQCVVFNCSDGLDYKAMGKFFKGLASSGAWACFDEFNRIELEVLSVVAQQILSIILAVRANLTKFVFEGTELILNPAVYICITMNPGYAGRSELPDNLKVLFRTVAMMVPDYAMIGEISLYSYGFKTARVLSVKIVMTYRLCSEQLSSQNHYDYGMRAVKTVLSACGNNKIKNPDENEDVVILRSLIDVNLPKFLRFDIPLFEDIISDLFPGVVQPVPDYSDLINACKEAYKERNLQKTDYSISKIIQTYEMMIVRHGYMLVGKPFCGKTTTLKVLADALTIMHSQGLNQVPVHYQFMNPKSITMGQLYGQFDPVSYEWTDGVVATCFRRFAMDQSPDRNWVIFDGPVDAVWIENMNTVLDDNKKLCLTSGEVMAMTPSMSMIFEVMDLAQASPATVSRCGMIYMEPEELGWEPIMLSWLAKTNPEWCEENDKHIVDLFNWLVPSCLKFIQQNCRQLVYPGNINQVVSTMNIMEMTMDDACAEYEDEGRQLSAWIQGSMVFAIIWGLAGILNDDSRIKFDEFFKSIWKNTNPDYPIPAEMDKLEIPLPTEGPIFDYVYVFKTPKGNWKYWPDLVRGIKMNEEASAQQVLVPTIDTARYMFIIEKCIKHYKPTLLIGPTGTGKSFYLQNLLMNQLDQNLFEPSFITFTAQTKANQTQELIISKLAKGKRGNFSAPEGKCSIMFIDDLNMPVKEVYGAQPPIELLRQFFDHKHWYNLKDTSKIFLHNVLLVAAMGLEGGSRQSLYERILRHFAIFSINEFSEESMVKIFTNVLFIAFKQNGFAQDVLPMVQCIVNATLNTYNFALEELRPTPAKSHYIFNMRDFSRIIQGCGLLKKESADNKKIFAKLWVHEILRVFYDRLVDDADRKNLFSKLRECVQEHFKENFDMTFENLKNSEGVIEISALRNLLFGTYMDLDALENERRYEEIDSIETFKGIAEACLEEFNSTSKSKMDIVLFRYALEHLSKLCRVLSMERGSALLVGVGGSGRQSLTRLATAICGYMLFQPEIGKNYGINEFRDDIKVILKEAGGLGKHTVFLFTEDQLKDESFLLDIDSLLNSGEVPNLYPIDEKQEIIELVRLAAQGGNRNIDVSPLAVFSFFINRCKEKLHIILCFSPVSPLFRARLRLFPSLINCCTIDWYEDWPEEGLQMVANHWMQELNVENDVKDAAVLTCKIFHVDARQISEEFYRTYGRKTYMTSASYLGLIKTYQTLTNTKQEELLAAKMRYVSGLEKLDFAASQVQDMQISLEKLQPQLKKMTEKAKAMLKEIESETKEAERASQLVRQDEQIANKQAAAAQSLKAECEADLAQAIPILEEAIEALNTLKPTDITLVKSMKNPPAAIKLVMAAVCVIKDIKPDRLPDPGTGRMVLDYWGPSKKVLGEMNFLQQLKEFDKDHIPIQIMTRIRKEFLPHKDFKPEVVAKASSAAEGLCKWIIAMDLYDAVAREVAPKKEKLRRAEVEYAATMSVLQEKRDQVARLEKRLEQLNEQLQEAQKEEERLQADVNLCSEKLVRAKKLIGGLGGEKNRWMNAAEQLQKQYDCLPGDVLISCGIIAYLAPFTMQIRLSTVSSWKAECQQRRIPCSQQYDFAEILGSEIKIQEWYAFGLPRDSFSTQNGLIQSISTRWSLLIDPQSQANKWIKNMEKNNNLYVVKFTDSNYMKFVEHGVQFGSPILIENITETLEAPIDPILSKRTFMQSGVLVIGLGDIIIPYHNRFRLYLTSKLRNPHYMPEVFNKVTIINFALTVEALEDQLLGIVVANENPDVQSQKEMLVIESAANKAALKNVEDSILKTLSETEGNILENESAIFILNQSKLLALDISQKQEITKETEKQIERFRLDYKPVATHSTVLYYSIADLPNVDPMYQYSLEWFINLYKSSIVQSAKTNDLKERLETIIDHFTYSLYKNICRSLFEKDKLLFSFVLCTKLMISKNELTDLYYLFFLTGGLAIENRIPNPASEWLSEKSWNELCRMTDLPIFDGFRNDFTKNLNDWQQYYDSLNPQKEVLPGNWKNRLSAFEKLIVLRVLRPDKVNVGIYFFVESVLGNRYVSPPPFNIGESYASSHCLSPLVFILSPGADPIMALTKFAERTGFGNKFKSISLGQGQGPFAEELVHKSMQDGEWACLQNCHLAVSWLPRLEKLCENMDHTNTHESFRMWLTSYPSDKFPVSVLQNSIKITNEPPTGLHQNLILSYTSDPIKDPSFYTVTLGKETEFAKLLYSICFFHAVVQERRTFGPLGWNIPYGFNDSDLQISIQQLQLFLSEYESVPYEALTYLIGECNYGGRVTDDWDRRLINTILADFINPSVINTLNYSFSNINACYNMPEKVTYSSVVDHIKSMPSQHPPDVFGLHRNAGITRDLQNANIMLASLLLVQGQMTSSGSSSYELLKIVITDTMAKIPAPFNLEMAKKKFPLEYSESMNTVLVQEMERFNRLTICILNNLKSMRQAVFGMIAMTPELEACGTAMLLGQIPSVWAKASYPSLKSLGNYINDFIERINFLQTWYDKGKPSTFWLSGFYFTQAFLTGIKQNYARKHTIPIDQLDFDYEIINADTMPTPSAEGVYVNGLFVDGARWDRSINSLAEQKPKVLWDVLPVVVLKPILTVDFKPNNRYKSPVYKTSERRGILSTTGHSTNYVLPIYLDTKVNPSHWIKRSVALLCQLD